MTTRIFKKPDLRKQTIEISESIFRDPKELEALKAKIKPEVYLSTLYDKIFHKEKELESIGRATDTIRQANDDAFKIDRTKKEKDIKDLESVLEIKRSEQVQLNKPVFDRMSELNQRETGLDERSKSLDEKEQSIFERERAYESKLDSLKDLSDELGEIRVRLSLREKKADAKEKTLATREMQYLAAVQTLREESEKARTFFQEKEYAIALKEMNVQGKEENLIKREKELLEGNIRLNDRRDVLDRAWKELEKKQHGNK